MDYLVRCRSTQEDASHLVLVASLLWILVWRETNTLMYTPEYVRKETTVVYSYTYTVYSYEYVCCVNDSSGFAESFRFNISDLELTNVPLNGTDNSVLFPSARFHI